MLDVGLIAARFVHYAATTALAGASFFPLYAYSGAEPERITRWRKKLVLAAAMLALLSGLTSFALTVVNMSGSLATLADPDVVLSVVRDTEFGMVAMLRMVVSFALVVAAALGVSSRATAGGNLTTSILAAALLVSMAGVGHTQIEDGWANVLHFSADAVHLLAAGAWLGGLGPLGFILTGRPGAEPAAGMFEVEGVLLRFSCMGYCAVATLVGTGLINGWFLVGSVSALSNTPYGQLLLVKLALFAGMLALAFANRFWLVPRIVASRAADLRQRQFWRAKLRNHVLWEQVLGLLVLLSVSIIGTMPPAAGG